MNSRAAAACVMCDVLDGRSLADALPKWAEKLKDPRDRALLQAMCFGVCRWFFCLDAIAQQLLDKPLKAKDQDIYALLLVGLYQLREMRIPDYAAVAETVAATKYFKKIWAKGLLNAVLREYQRRTNTLSSNISDEIVYSHPAWMLNKLKHDYPNDWCAIAEANNAHPPFALRVNQRRLGRGEYLEKLRLAGMNAKEIPETLSGIVLESPVDVEQLPGFLAGEVSVQDGAAQLAAECLMLEPGQFVLDACAAPGGKTGHILELQRDIKCIAVDQDAHRLEAVKENLQRLGLSADCIAADVSDTGRWWNGQLFDRILLDAPCSASGVIRRHPDIKLLRCASDIAILAETQSRILRAVWQLLKPGGLLLYATCSIFPDENVQVLQQFLEAEPDATEEKIMSTWGRACMIGKQILPGMHGMDGFYFARLRK